MISGRAWASFARMDGCVSTPLENPKPRTRRAVKGLLRPADHACAHEPDWVIGFDEVGMGCLAGPVVAAAFAYPLAPEWLALEPPCQVRDSKKMNESARAESAAWLSQVPGALHAIVEVSPAEIDEVNILRAAQLAMSRCFEQVLAALPFPPQGARTDGGLGLRVGLLVDGNKIPREFQRLAAGFRAECLVKGDAKSFPIAAASILAKEHRDGLMARLAGEHPGYGWESNVGYPTTEHKAAIHSLGPTAHHRRSFNWI